MLLSEDTSFFTLPDSDGDAGWEDSFRNFVLRSAGPSAKGAGSRNATFSIDCHAVFSALLGQSPVGFVVVDPDDRVLLINPGAAELFNYDRSENPDITWTAIRKMKDLRAFDETPLHQSRDPLYMAMRQNKRIMARVLIRTPGFGMERWVNVTAFPITDEQGNMVAGAAVVLDITDFKSMQDMLYYQATHDPLTGLSNRALFSASVTKAIARSKRNRLTGAILVLDLDKFKEVNDTLGHAAGDELLIKVAERMRREVRDTDVIARMGGDEFYLLLADMGEAGADVAGEIAGRICKSLARPFTVRNCEIEVTVSVGLSVFPRDGLDEEVLVSRADAAMYQVKEQGRNGWKFWEDPELNKVLRKV